MIQNICRKNVIYKKLFFKNEVQSYQFCINDNFTFQIKKKSNSRLQVSYEFSDDDVSYEFSDEDEEQDLDIDALQQLWETFYDLMEKPSESSWDICLQK